MTDEVERSSACETPIWFRAGAEDVFGILTAPRGRRRNVGVVLLPPGGPFPSTGRNRMEVVLARRLAASGFHVLRFDYLGTAESSGMDRIVHMARLGTRELLAAARELWRRGVNEFVFVGRCFGARTALSAAGRVRGLRALVFISMPLHWWAEDLKPALPSRIQVGLMSGLLDHRTRRRSLRLLYYVLRRWAERPWPTARGGGLAWVDPTVERRLRRTVRSGVRLLFLYGAQDDDYREFREAQRGVIGALLSRAGGRARVEVLPGHQGHMHYMLTIRMQQAVTTRIEEWIAGVVAPPQADHAGGAWPRDTAGATGGSRDVLVGGDSRIHHP